MDQIAPGWLLPAATLVLGSTGMWGFLTMLAKTRRSSPAAIATSQADLVEALNAQTRAFVEELQKDRRELRVVVARQARSIRKLVTRVEDLETENETCLQNGRLLTLRLAVFEQVLRANGIPIPADQLPGSLIVMEGEDRTAMTADGEIRTAKARPRAKA